MSFNVNTREYWDQRFASGNWEQSRGRWQTTAFAQKQVRLLRVASTFDGTIVDFGCGLGDALPIYKTCFPSAKLIGVDHSNAAILECQKAFAGIATFVHGDAESVPKVDVIVASNVLEHITDDKTVIEILLSKCSELYVFVPYKEHPLCPEHVNYYDRESLSFFEVIETKVYWARGWSKYGRGLWIDAYLKNLLRPFLGRPLVGQKKQIMFRIRGSLVPTVPDGPVAVQHRSASKKPKGTS